jgi:two-component system, OmpR family, KDP operon response regulator KdpE
MHVLIAEDSPDVAEVVAFSARLTWPECVVTIAGSGAEALAVFAERQPDLLILDVAMPPPDGFEVCQQVRATSDVPILMLTVRNTTMDKVRGFDLGVDDYLTKPFDHLELMARMRALLRRSAARPGIGDEPIVVGDLTLDEGRRLVSVVGEPVALTSTEYRLLEFLVRHAGQVMPHQTILEHVWGDAYRNDVHYLKVFVRRLRQKLGDDAARPRYIQTEWGIGYRFVAPHHAA